MHTTHSPEAQPVPKADGYDYYNLFFFNGAIVGTGMANCKWAVVRVRVLLVL